MFHMLPYPAAPRWGGHMEVQVMTISKSMWAALCNAAEWHTDQQKRQPERSKQWVFTMELEKYLNGHVCAWPRYK